MIFVQDKEYLELKVESLSRQIQELTVLLDKDEWLKQTKVQREEISKAKIQIQNFI